MTRAGRRRLITLGQRGLVGILSSVLAFQPILARAGGITPDVNAPVGNQPGVGAAPNGVPLVDIVTPNASGLSHNKYGSFNVGTPGLILNNFNGEVGTSLLGGLTPGNPNLKGSGPATVILNEVTGGGRSALKGATEVFGGRADVVIANPNGITCSGCGFINTPHATLSTGLPEIGADGRLSGLTVKSGDVTFGAGGGNFAAGQGAVDLFDVVSRSVKLDGPVNGKTLRLTAGANRFDYATGTATALEGVSGTPEYAIDGSALGAMQADRIKIVVTDKGAGVRMSGDMAANTGELSLSADGKISIGNASGVAGVTLRSKAQVQAKKLTSKKAVTVAASRAITLQSVAADGDIVLDGGVGLVTATAALSGLASLTVTADGGLDLASVEAGGPVALKSAAGSIRIMDAARSDNDLTVVASAGAIHAASLVSGRNLSLTAGLDIGITTDLMAAGTVHASAASIEARTIGSGMNLAATRASGTPVLGNAGGDLRLQATSATIAASQLLSAGSLAVTAAKLGADNVSAHGTITITGNTDIGGQLIGGGDIRLSGNAISVGSIVSGLDFAATDAAGGAIRLGPDGDLTIDATSGTITSGTLLVAGNLSATAATFTADSVTSHGGAAITGNTTVSGSVLAGRDLTITGPAIRAGSLVSGVDFAATERSGAVEIGAADATGAMTLHATAGPLEAGTIIAAGPLEIAATTTKANTVTTHGDAAISGNTDIAGQLLGGGDIRLSGHAISAGSIVSGLDFAATDAAGGAIRLGTDGDLTIDATSGTITSGTLLVAGNLSATAATFTADSITSHGSAAISGGTTVSGAVLAGGDLTITGPAIRAGSLVSGVDLAATERSGAVKIGAAGAMTLHATAGPLETGTIISAGPLEIAATTTKADTVTSHGDAAISGNTDIAGQLLGGGNIRLSGNAISVGSIVSGIDFTATDAAGGAIRLGTAGDLTIDATAGTLTSGTLLSAGAVSATVATVTADTITASTDVNVSGKLDVNGQLLAGRNVTLGDGAISAGIIAAGVDLAQTTASGSVVLTGSGDLTIASDAAAADVGSLVASGNLAVRAATLSADGIIAHGTVTVDGNSDIGGQLLGGSNITLSGGDIAAGAIVSGLDFAATEAANGVIRLGTDGNLTINATSGTVTSGTLLVAGDLSAATATLVADSITSHGRATISGNTTVSGSVFAGGDLKIAGPTIRAGTLASGVDLAATETSGTVTLGSAGAMTLQATAGSIAAGYLLSAGDMSATATGDISAQAISHGGMQLSAGGNVALEGQSLAAGDIAITAQTIDAGTLVSGVDFAASAAQPSGGLNLNPVGTLTLTATAGSIAAGSLVSAGDLAATAERDITYGGLQSFADANLTSLSGTISLDRATRALGDISIAASSVDLSNNRGQIATGRTLSITARDADFSGSAYTFGGIDLRLSGRADLIGATLSAVTGAGDGTSAAGSGDITVSAAGLDTDAGTAVLAERDLTLTLPTLTNSGQIAAGRDLTVSLSGDLVNGPTGLLYAADDAGLFVAGKLTNDQGAMLAGNALTIAADATGAKNGSVTNISGLIQAGGDGTIATNELINRRLVNPTWTNVLVSSDVVTGFELNPEVAGKPFAFLFGGTSDGRELYPGIGPQFWADYEPLLWSQATAADGGSYRAWTWISGNGPRWVGEIGRWIRERVPTDANGTPVLDPNNPSRYFIVQYVNPGADTSTTYSWDFDANISQSVHEDQLTDAGSPQAMIRAGGDLTIDATSLTNSYSAIEADGDVTLTGDQLVNEGLALTRTTTTTCNAQGACEYYDADGNPDPSMDIAQGTSIISSVETIGSEGGTIRAGGNVDISGFATIDNRAAEGSVAGAMTLAAATDAGDPLAALDGLTAGAALFTPNAAIPGLAASLGLTTAGGLAVAGQDLLADGGSAVAPAGVSADPGFTIGNDDGAMATWLAVNGPALAALAKPDSGGFGGTIPGQVFLFETRPAFLDVGKFYGSGYFLDRIGYKPDWRVPFLGDAYFENQLIDQQLRQLAGQGLGGSFLPGSDMIEQMKLLLDRGVDYARQQNLALGTPLSKDQIAALTQSIVLYETRTVNGILVLAPVVYLAAADKAKVTAAGALIAGTSVKVNAGTLKNSGAIAAVADLSLTGNSINANGGSFVAGGNLKLAATGKLTLEAQTVQIGGIKAVNPNAMVKVGGNALIGAGDALTLRGAKVDVSGNAVLVGKSVTLDAVNADNRGSHAITAGGNAENATGARVSAGGDLAIQAIAMTENGRAGNVTVIGSAAKAGGDLTVTAESGSVSVVTTDVSRKAGDGYTTTIEAAQQEGQLVSGGSTTVTAGDDILISGSSIRSGADVALDAGDDINIAAAQETTSERFGKSHVSAERHQSSEIVAGGSITAKAGEATGDHDLNTIGSKLQAKERVDLKAADDLTIAEARDSKTADYVWNGGGDKTKSHEEAQTAVGSSVSGGAGVSTRSGGDTLVSASTLEAGTDDRTADLSVKADGDLVVTSGKDTYEKHAQSQRKGFLSKTSASEDRVHETTVASELGASGNLTLDAGEDLAISGSTVDAGQSVAIEGDNVAILGAEENHADAEQKKKSGLFAGSGDGFVSLWGKESKEKKQTATDNIGSVITAGEDVSVTAREGDVAVIGSAIDAGKSCEDCGDIALSATRDVTITPGKEAAASEQTEKRSGFGIAYSSGGGGASIGIGYGSAKDAVSQSSDTNAVSTLSAGRDVKITAGRDANLQAAEIEAERDVAITATRDVNLLSAQDRSNYEEVHEQLFAGVTLSVSTGLVSAAESVGNAARKIGNISDGYSAANAAFAGLKAYDALDNIVNGNVVSGSLTVGFTYSKDRLAGETSVPVTTDIRAGQSVTIEAVSGDITGRGTQIAAGYDAHGLPVASDSDKAGDIALSAGKDIKLENAEATNSSSSSSKSAGASIGVGGGVSLSGGVGFGLTGGANASSGKSKANGTTAVNSHVTGSGDVTLLSGNDMTLKGAVVSGDTVTADVGGDLTIVSTPDTGKSSNKSVSGGFSLGGGQSLLSGIQIGGGKGSGNTNWISEQSGLISDGQMDVTVGGNTHLSAGKIISESSELALSTETLTHENFDGEIQYEGFNANVGIDLTGGKGTSANPVGNSTLEGNYKLDDTRQEVNATVGPGEIEIRDEEKQAALEQDGASTLPLDELNRDPDQAYQITKDKHVDLEVYLSTNSLKAALDAGQTIAEAFTAALDRMVADGKLSPNDRSAAAELSAHRNDPKVLAQLASCGQKQGAAGFNLFDWLITPAHANPASCVISTGGQSYTISPMGAAACLQYFLAETGLAVSQVTSATAATTAGLAGLFLLASATPAGGNIDEKTTLKDGTVVHLTGQQGELKRNVIVTLPNGQDVSLVLNVTASGGYELVAGRVLDGAIPVSMLADTAKQLSRGGISVVYNQKSEADYANEEKPNLLEPDAAAHVLDGDAEGGGHRPGTGNPGKSEFPSGWSDEKILGEISDVATDPASDRSPGRDGATIVIGEREGVKIRVIVGSDGKIISGWPVKGPGVVQNPK